MNSETDLKIENRHRRASQPRPSVDRIQEEIMMIEKRLRELGPDGDCGYENAMIRFYERQLGLRRQQLIAVD
jgi:hypothetical protein